MGIPPTGGGVVVGKVSGPGPGGPAVGGGDGGGGGCVVDGPGSTGAVAGGVGGVGVVSAARTAFIISIRSLCLYGLLVLKASMPCLFNLIFIVGS